MPRAEPPEDHRRRRRAEGKQAERACHDVQEQAHGRRRRQGTCDKARQADWKGGRLGMRMRKAGGWRKKARRTWRAV